MEVIRARVFEVVSNGGEVEGTTEKLGGFKYASDNNAPNCDNAAVGNSILVL